MKHNYFAVRIRRASFRIGNQRPAVRTGWSKKQATNRRFFVAIIITANFLPLVVTSPSHAEEALSRTKRAMLQAKDEAVIKPGGFQKENHLSGDWGGARTRLFESGVEVF